MHTISDVFSSSWTRESSTYTQSTLHNFTNLFVYFACCSDDFKMYLQKFKEMEKAYTKQVKAIKQMKSQGKSKASAVSLSSTLPIPELISQQFLCYGLWLTAKEAQTKDKKKGGGGGGKVGFSFPLPSYALFM